MGVNGLLPELPGGEEKLYGFPSLNCFSIEIDTGLLVFVCSHRHKEAFNSGKYMPAARKFQRQIITLTPDTGRQVGFQLYF